MITIIAYILYALKWLVWLYSILMVIDAIMSWVPSLRNSAVGQLLNRLIEPYVNIFRKGPIQKISYATGLDLSFLLGLLLLYFIQDYVFGWLVNILLRVFA
ncbi:YggT family protein [Lactobacillus sp. ESL0785]|uniref:YggT family protein n=1 Tax=Lactobacillus sp. ESL0785 TaxID=2983232 RepID=UPI0023F9BAAB|nr:YggT family protein [Lactobacillus sp. ESL0785]WEV71525.1 YggT family protein [Lactobacillus sp. ESL0785]